jgi:hypothetical protein
LAVTGSGHARRPPPSAVERAPARGGAGAAGPCRAVSCGALAASRSGVTFVLVRFVVVVEVVVEADSVAELDVLADDIEIAAAASARDRISHDPADRAFSNVCIEALDHESLAALVRNDHWAAGNGVRGADAEPPGACELRHDPTHVDGQ